MSNGQGRVASDGAWPVLGLVLALVASLPVSASAEELRGPRQARVLSDATRILVHDSPKSLTLHRVSDGQAMHRFAAAEPIIDFDVTLDDQLVVAVCWNGDLGAWSVATGAKAWWRSAAEAGIGQPTDVSFASDGRSLVVASNEGYILVLDAATGSDLSHVDLPSRQPAMSACLSPDGLRGAVLSATYHLFVIDVAAGIATDSGIRGAWPVRWSSGGQWLFMRSNDGGGAEKFRRIDASTLEVTDVGELEAIRTLRALGDGRFIATATEQVADGPLSMGVVVEPNAPSVNEVWRGRWADGLWYVTDFDVTTGIAVSTDFEFLTRVVDMATMRTKVSIDHHDRSGQPSPGSSWPWAPILAGVAAAGVLLAVAVSLRRRKRPAAGSP